MLNSAHSWALAFSSYSPERAQAEPGEGHCEADRDHDAASRRVFRGIFTVLADQGDPTEGCHGQKNRAGHLKPQKMEDMRKGSSRCTDRAYGGIHASAAAGHIARHA